MSSKSMQTDSALAALGSVKGWRDCFRHMPYSQGDVRVLVLDNKFVVVIFCLHYTENVPSTTEMYPLNGQSGKFVSHVVSWTMIKNNFACVLRI